MPVVFTRVSTPVSKSKDWESSSVPESSTSGAETGVEYVQPVKLVPSQDEEDQVAVEYHKDALEEEDQMPLLRHHSGHYRHHMATVWDPHPEYEFQAFGQLFHLNLELNSDFVTPNIEVTHVYKNTTTRELPRLKTNGCFYSGKVKGDSLSSIAVNLCNGMLSILSNSKERDFLK
ncbi:hypothetical protein M8J77_018405 [Diaphorina citri]|nr:hypothetical protein M8J77_018405 [Diaphorina citri]